MSGPTVDNPLAVYGAGVATYTRSALRRSTSTQPPAADTGHWQRGKNLTLPIITAVAMQKNYLTERHSQPP